MGGHMHLFSRQHLVASSGIVGASAPAAVGFALSARYLRPGKVSVAFFGEGAMNQGMLLESFNLAASWKLPVLFVCKDNRWSITTHSESVTAGNLLERVKSFGLKAREIDGSDVLVVWKAAQEAFQYVRDGKGPAYLHMHCFRPEGHFLGDPLIRIARRPIKEMRGMAGSLIKSVSKIKGSSLSKRTESLGTVSSVLGKTFKRQFFKGNDPLELLRKRIVSDKKRLDTLEEEVQNEIQNTLEKSLQYETDNIMGNN
jgi:pyruvate dehydrogenase E1 component alpha subunit